MTKVDWKIGERVTVFNVSVWEQRGETEVRWMLANVHLFNARQGQ